MVEFSNKGEICVSHAREGTRPPGIPHGNTEPSGYGYVRSPTQYGIGADHLPPMRHVRRNFP